MAANYTYDEKDLLLQAGEGDESSFAALFHLYKYKLYGYIFRLTGSHEATEDMVQDIFLKLWSNRSSLSRIDYFSSYIFQMAQNQAVNAFKRMARETLILRELQDNSRPEEASTMSEEILSLKETSEWLSRAIDKLPQQQKKIFLLSREQGLKHEEIARRLGISQGTVKNHMIQALRTLRQQLDKHPDALVSIYCILLAIGAIKK